MSTKRPLYRQNKSYESLISNDVKIGMNYFIGTIKKKSDEPSYRWALNTVINLLPHYFEHATLESMQINPAPVFKAIDNDDKWSLSTKRNLTSRYRSFIRTLYTINEDEYIYHKDLVSLGTYLSL